MKLNTIIGKRIDIGVITYFLTFGISLSVYFSIDYLWNGNNFLFLFTLLGGSILAILFLYRMLFGKVIWKYLPTVLTIYIFIALFIPTIIIYKSDLLRELLEWDNYLILKAASLGLLFIQFLWVCFHIGVLIFRIKDTQPVVKKLPLGKIYILIAMAILANFIAIISGTFGVLEVTEAESTTKYGMYIDLGQQLGLFGLIMLAYHYTQKKGLILGVGLLFFLFGILSAQKQAALMPLLAIAVTMFFKTGKLPKLAIGLAVAGLLFSFAAVSTIREYYFASKSKGVTSISEVQEIVRKGLNQKSFDKAYDTYNINEHILMRVFYGSAVGKAIEYCELNSYGVPENNRLIHVLLSPLYAVIPRIILPQKPVANFGNWFATEVFVGYKVKYSIGVTPVGYGYMVNGVQGVIAVAALLGLFMAFLFKILYINHTFIYLLVFMKSILPADVTWEYFAGNIKLIIVYLIIYKLLTVTIFPKK